MTIHQKFKKEEETNGVLMHQNDMLEYRGKILEAVEDGTFSSEHLKKSVNAAYHYVLKDVNSFIQEINSMEEKINLSLFDDFFESSSPADSVKMLINAKNPRRKQINCIKIEIRISDLKEKIKDMSETGKKMKGRMRH